MRIVQNCIIIDKTFKNIDKKKRKFTNINEKFLEKFKGPVSTFSLSIPGHFSSY